MDDPIDLGGAGSGNLWHDGPTGPLAAPTSTPVNEPAAVQAPAEAVAVTASPARSLEASQQPVATARGPVIVIRSKVPSNEPYADIGPNEFPWLDDGVDFFDMLNLPGEPEEECYLDDFCRDDDDAVVVWTDGQPRTEAKNAAALARLLAERDEAA